MSTKYDPAIIQKLADKLYASAATIVFVCTVIFGLGGAAAGYAYGGRDEKFAVVGGLVGAVLGYLIGQWRAFYIRVLAQTALCQKQIEENTRPIRPGVVSVKRPGQP